VRPWRTRPLGLSLPTCSCQTFHTPIVSLHDAAKNAATPYVSSRKRDALITNYGPAGN
jgi:hypothetical protein